MYINRNPQNQIKCKKHVYFEGPYKCTLIMLLSVRSSSRHMNLSNLRVPINVHL